MKRTLLFVATNVAVLALIAVVFGLLGLDSVLQQNNVGLDLTSLLIFSAVIGFGGAFVSLAMSKWSAKRMTGARVIEQPANATEQWLIETVRRQAGFAKIDTPEVAIFPSPTPNAFATGARKNAALVAVSEGLLRHMSRDEVEAVLGHEVAHVANGDMVTLTLIQGVVNTFVVFLSRVAGHLVDRIVFRNQEGYGPGYFLVSIIAQVLFGLLASLIVMAFSRQREFRADAGGAYLAGRHKMIAALEKLRRAQEGHLPDQLAAFGIKASRRAGLARYFMSHPPLEERIEALRAAPEGRSPGSLGGLTQ